MSGPRHGSGRESLLPWDDLRDGERLREARRDLGRRREERARIQAVTTEDLFAAALSLPEKQRAELAGRLLKSLDELPEDEWEAKWAAESERRLDEVRAGRMTERPAEDVFRDASRS